MAGRLEQNLENSWVIDPSGVYPTGVHPSDFPVRVVAALN